jgi:hypothetical protein
LEWNEANILLLLKNISLLLPSFLPSFFVVYVGIILRLLTTYFASYYVGIIVYSNCLL